MSTESITQASEGAVGDAGLARDLSERGAGNEAMEDGLEESATSQPVRGGERL